MTYATVSDLVARFGEQEIIELTNLDLGSATVIDQAAADRALSDATAEIDGYLAARYRLPVSGTPHLLSMLCTDIARFRLQKGVSTEQARQRYEDAVDTLKRISRGEMNLPLETPPPVTGSPMAVPGRARVFDDDTLRGY